MPKLKIKSKQCENPGRVMTAFLKGSKCHYIHSLEGIFSSKSQSCKRRGQTPGRPWVWVLVGQLRCFPHHSYTHWQGWGKAPWVFAWILPTLLKWVWVKRNARWGDCLQLSSFLTEGKWFFHQNNAETRVLLGALLASTKKQHLWFNPHSSTFHRRKHLFLSNRNLEQAT